MSSSVGQLITTTINNESLLMSFFGINQIDLKEENDFAFLSSEEKRINSHYAYKRQKEFALGRYCAKKALQQLLVEEIAFDSLTIGKGKSGEPIVEGKLGEDYHVSISHSEQMIVALACPKKVTLGIDIEHFNDDYCKDIYNILTREEKTLIKRVTLCENSALYALWVAKESLAKALKTGFNLPLSDFEINKFEEKDGIILKAKKYPDLYTIVLIVEDWILSISTENSVYINTSEISQTVKKIVSG